MSSSAVAGVSTDASLGHPAQTLTGPNYLIPQSLGLLAGSNLFQSFQTFGLNSGESANFTTSTSGIANVISRVTGGSLSQISGQISLTPCTGCGSPNFVFINPAGITFGAGAAVNVPGAFHVSTADYVKLPGGNFYADLSKASTFSIAAPQAFGFLGTGRAAITVNSGATLQAQPGQAISIAAGDVTLDSGRVSTMSGGDIRVTAIGQAAQEVGFSGPLPAANGNLTILNGGAINADTASSTAAGSVAASAGNISIDGNASVNASGIAFLGISSTSSTSGNTGNAGNVNVAATGNISLANGGVISADTYSAGNAGSVTIGAANITVDGSLRSGGTRGGYSTRISSQTYGDSSGFFGSTGNAGAVNVATTGAISIQNGGSIDADSTTLGNAGPVTITAGSIMIDGNGHLAFKGISSDAKSTAGNAGSIDITCAGNLSLINGGNIFADTVGSGSAGNITINAANISVDGRGNGNVYTGIWSEADNGTGNAGNISLTTTGGLSVLNGAEISASTYTAANAGSITANAGSINLDGNGLFDGMMSITYSGTGNAGSVSVRTPGNLSLINGGGIAASTLAAGNAGTVTINAGSINIDGQGNSNAYTGIGSSADAPNSGPIAVTGNAGTISVTVTGNLSIVNGGHVSADTHTTGDAGIVAVNAGSITMDGQGYTGITDISSNVVYGTGKGGSVKVDASGNISIANAAQITTATLAAGDAGAITVNAGSINIDGQRNINGPAGIFSDASAGSRGNAGVLHVTSTGAISIVNGGTISTSTASSGNAGATIINADSISIDGQGYNSAPTGILSDAFPGSSGNAGSVNVTTAGNLSMFNNGQISTATLSVGNAGSISINSGSINIDGQGAVKALTGIYTDAFTDNGGNAGAVNVTINGLLSIVNGGSISSSTSSAGNAGNIAVNAGSINIDGQGDSHTLTGVIAAAFAGSSGQTGTIAVTAAKSIALSNSGQISIANDASVASPAHLTPTSISVDAPSITVLNSPIAITAWSFGNVDAGSIKITSMDGLSMTSSGIYTTAIRGNGGFIYINADLIRLDNSQITSVSKYGKGGDIKIISNALVMNTGYILAYASTGQAGGNIVIEVPNLIASGNTLFVGQADIPFLPGIFGLNVIQATGTVHTSSPALDIAGSLIGLNSKVIDTGGLAKNPCQITGGSSLSLTGQGGLPPSARGLLRAELQAGSGYTGNAHRLSDTELRLALSDWGCN